jgi:type II secretory pathway component PulM
VEYVAAALLLLVLVGLVVIRPLLSRGEPERRDEARHEELEAAKEAKYREIRDAELDFRMGKLSEAQWRALDRELRAEAIEILRQIDRGGGARPSEQPLP